VPCRIPYTIRRLGALARTPFWCNQCPLCVAVNSWAPGAHSTGDVAAQALASFDFAVVAEPALVGCCTRLHQWKGCTRLHWKGTRLHRSCTRLRQWVGTEAEMPIAAIPGKLPSKALKTVWSRHDITSGQLAASKAAHKVRVQTRVRSQRQGVRVQFWLWTQEPESKPEPDRVWTQESESKPESDLVWTQESESTWESDLAWTQEPESTGESDRVWTQEPEATGEPDLQAIYLDLD
jgi:hypothetical protein